MKTQKRPNDLIGWMAELSMPLIQARRVDYEGLFNEFNI
jgi:hypothetical protein